LGKEQEKNVLEESNADMDVIWKRLRSWRTKETLQQHV